MVIHPIATRTFPGPIPGKHSCHVSSIVEQLFCKEKVEGASPSHGSRKKLESRLKVGRNFLTFTILVRVQVLQQTVYKHRIIWYNIQVVERCRRIEIHQIILKYC